MGPITAITHFYTHYFDVYGRSRRFEYAWVLLLHPFVAFITGSIVYFVAPGALDSDGSSLNAIGTVLSTLYFLFVLSTIIPSITLNIRRFHDMGYSGWMLALFAGLWVYPPLGALGFTILFFWMLFGSGTAGSNKYGQDPRFSAQSAF